jgi:hypothetical protein
MCSARPVSRRTSIRRVGSLPRMRGNIMLRLATCGVAAVLCALRKARELAGGVGSYREDHVGATAVQVVRASRPGSRALSISARCTSGNWSR